MVDLKKKMDDACAELDAKMADLERAVSAEQMAEGVLSKAQTDYEKARELSKQMRDARDAAAAAAQTAVEAYRKAL